MSGSGTLRQAAILLKKTNPQQSANNPSPFRSQVLVPWIRIGICACPETASVFATRGGTTNQLRLIKPNRSMGIHACDLGQMLVRSRMEVSNGVGVTQFIFVISNISNA